MQNNLKKLNLEPPRIAKLPVRLGFVLMIVFFGVFVGWGSLAPLVQAVIANGKITVKGQVKTVQHKFGGIIDTIEIKNGDFVEAGQPLIRLDQTETVVQLNLLRKQMIALIAKKTRLIAERELETSLSINAEGYEDLGEAAVNEILEGETQQFKVRSRIVRGQLSIYKQKIRQLQDELKGIRSQIKAANTQIAILKPELINVQYLYEDEHATEQEVNALKNRLSELQGNLGSYTASLSKAKQMITETEMDSMKFRQENHNAVVSELQQVFVQMADIEERITVAKDSLNRSTIKAPYSGIITGLKFHTIGGVIPPGAPILEIVPQNEELIIEGNISPQDIDLVKTGLKAKCKLSAFKAKNVPMFMGEVTHVSADSILDPNTGATFFLTQIKIDSDTLDPSITLHSGMVAEIYIVTGARTFLQYFFSPITDALRKWGTEV